MSVAAAEVWPDLARRALEQHPQLQAAALEQAALGLDQAAVRLDDFPSVGVQSVYGAGGRSIADRTLLRLRQPLWNGGQTQARVQQLRRQSEQVGGEAARLRLDLALALLAAHCQQADAEARLALWQGYQDRLQRWRGVLQHRITEGVSAVNDQAVIDLRLAQVQAGRQAVAQEVQLARRHLQRLSLQPIDQPATGLPEPALTPRTDAAPTHSPDNHPYWQLAQAEVAIAEAEGQVARSQRWPSVSLQYRRPLFGSARNPEDDQATALVLDYQSDSGLRAYRHSQASELRSQSARLAVQEAAQEVLWQRQQAQQQRDSAEAQWQVQQAAVQAADALEDSALRQFQAGRKSWLEALNSSREAHDVRLQAQALRTRFQEAHQRHALHQHGVQVLDTPTQVLPSP